MAPPSHRSKVVFHCQTKQVKKGTQRSEQSLWTSFAARWMNATNSPHYALQTSACNELNVHLPMRCQTLPNMNVNNWHIGSLCTGPCVLVYRLRGIDPDSPWGVTSTYSPPGFFRKSRKLRQTHFWSRNGKAGAIPYTFRLVAQPSNRDKTLCNSLMS